MSDLNEKIIDANFLLLVLSKLKLVLNPTQWLVSDETTDRIYFKLSTDLSSLEDIAVIVNGTTDSNKVILFNGYISNSVQNNITGINYGSQLIKCLGYYYENGLLQIVIGIENPNNLEATSELVRKLLVEVLISSDTKNHCTKNHCTEIIALDGFPGAQGFTTAFAGETGNNWEYTIIGNLTSDPEGTAPRSLTIDPTFTSTIDKISKAQTADKLANNITFHISGENVEETSSTLDFNNDPTNVDLEVNVDTQDLKDYIDDQINQKPINPASTERIGGFREYGGTGSPQKPNNWYAVNIDDTDDYNYAYVDLTNFQPSSEDEKHRYTDMSEAPEVAGTIVQYIGPSDDTYIKGYFYQFTPTDFDVVTSNQKWMFSVDDETTGTAIANYNFKVDYQITSGDLVFTMVPENSSENWEVSDDSVFIISQNSAELVRLTYGEIKNLFKIEIKLNYRTDPDNTLTLTLSIPTGAAAWKQKNVQPMLKVGSPLVYKRTILATQGQTDIEALEANVPVEGRELGDFYIVRPSNQEYCWISDVLPTEIAHWEFMGEVVTVPTYTGGNHISITGSGSNYTISDSGLQETLTAGNNIKIANNTISAEGYTYDATKLSFAVGLDTSAFGVCSHAEGNTTDAYGMNAHAEGQDTTAYGSSSHAEGTMTRSIGSWSHSEGYTTIASGESSHAEGRGTNGTLESTFSWDTNSSIIVSSNTNHGLLENLVLRYDNICRKIVSVNGSNITLDASFGEGQTNVHLQVPLGIGYGNYSHAEGRDTTALGQASHTEGRSTIAKNSNEHAEGALNVSHDSSSLWGNAGNTLHSVGFGYTEQTVPETVHHRNAFEIMQNGDAYLYGVGGYQGTNTKVLDATIKTLLDVISNIHSVNDGTYSVKVDVSGTETTISDFTANLSTADSVTFVQGSNVTLTPDAANGKVTIAATDTTYNTFGGSGSNHSSGLVPDPGATAGTSKYLCENGLWSTPAGAGLTGVTYNGTTATVTGGVAAIKDNDVVTTNPPTTITYETAKYIKKSLTGGSFAITVDTSGAGITDNGAKEIIYRIDNSTSTATITVTKSGNGSCKNMFNADLNLSVGMELAADKTLELVFTFWSPTDVTFNGGVSV